MRSGSLCPKRKLRRLLAEKEFVETESYHRVIEFDPAQCSRLKPEIFDQVVCLFSAAAIRLFFQAGGNGIRRTRHGAVHRQVGRRTKALDQRSDLPRWRALCETIPGATAMQTAAYVGFRARGISGAAASFIGFGLPAFLLMVGLSTFYGRSHALPAVMAAFNGLQAIVVAIVANATVMFGKTFLKDLQAVGIALIAAVLFAFGVSPILVIVLAAMLGIVLSNRSPPPIFVPQSQSESHSTKSLMLIASIAALGFGALFFVQRQLFDLAAIMLRIDLFAFGGGFASVPLMFHEFVEVRSWIDAQTFLNGIALGQITPGPIVITATFVGYMVYGLIGAIVATVSVFLPSFLIVIGVTP